MDDDILSFFWSSVIEVRRIFTVGGLSRSSSSIATGSNSSSLLLALVADET